MTIIYADDDPDDRELFADALKELDPTIRLVLVKNGMELISLLQNGSDKPDYIFLDVNMPVMGGKECLRKLKMTEHIKDTPVVMYTTASSKLESRNFLDMGAAAFVVKEPSFTGIKNSLRRVIAS